MHIRLHEAKYIASFEKAAERHLGQSRWKYEDRGARGTLPPRTKNGNVRSGRVLKVRTPVSSSCLFCAFFSNSPGRGVGTCEECDTKNRLPARYSSETDGCLISRGLRNRGPIHRAICNFNSESAER